MQSKPPLRKALSTETIDERLEAKVARAYKTEASHKELTVHPCLSVPAYIANI